LIPTSCAIATDPSGSPSSVGGLHGEPELPHSMQSGTFDDAFGDGSS